VQQGSSTQFPPGFDPNYFPGGDSRTWATARTGIGGPSELVTDWSAAADDINAGELQKLLQRLDFDGSPAEDVARCERAMFACLRREASELQGSAAPLTSRLVEKCVLEHESLPEALAAMLSSKVSNGLPAGREPLPEDALRLTMARVLKMPDARRAVVSDLAKVLVVDPAADGLLQPMLFFKGFHALTTMRVGHALWNEGGAANQGAALMLQSRVSELFGVDLHPGAKIGNGVMLDHATGIVIGSTAVVGSDVYMLHGVTLGATGKPTGGAKRHPTVGSRVILGAGCTVLGDVTVADGCTVGALGIVTKDIPEGSTVVGVNKIVSRPETATADAPAAKDDYTWYYDI
jgi:serine O-acetyltransferase